jgi:predicted nucleic acid-binding protein
VKNKVEHEASLYCFAFRVNREVPRATSNVSRRFGRDLAGADCGIRVPFEPTVDTFDRSTAELARRIAVDLERTGQLIGLAGPMIGAVALQHGPELVTGNTAHFQRVQQLGYPLTLVNWRI